MTSLQHSRQHHPPQAFLVERYVSPAAAEDLVESTARLAQLCAEPGHSDPAVRYLFSAYLSTEDTCFCLFRADSAEAVRAVNVQAHFDLDRVSEVALLLHLEPVAPT